METLDVQFAFGRDDRPKSVKTIERFEEGGTWPNDPQATVAAYAELAGVEPVELWQRAINRWEAALATAEGRVPGAPPADVRTAGPRAEKTNRAKGSRQGA